MSGVPRDGWRAFLIRDTPVHSLKTAPAYWRGSLIRRSDDPADEACERRLLAAGWRLAVLVERSGLAVLDCDVRGEWEHDGNTARLVMRSGIDDLRRVAGELGQKVTPTFAVRTKSGGLHLYYRQSPRWPVSSHGHAPGWRVDVKASKNAYVVAPPSPGYSVLRDRPVAVFPRWLAERAPWRQARPGRGGRARGGGSGRGGPLSAGRREGILAVVADSNAAGGWNNALYQAARRLFEAGEGPEEVTGALLEAAAPWDEREAARARKTVESAWHGHCEERPHHTARPIIKRKTLSHDGIEYTTGRCRRRSASSGGSPACGRQRAGLRERRIGQRGGRRGAGAVERGGRGSLGGRGRGSGGSGGRGSRDSLGRPSGGSGRSSARQAGKRYPADLS